MEYSSMDLIQANIQFVGRLAYAHPDVAAQLLMQIKPEVRDDEDEIIDPLPVPCPPGAIGRIIKATAAHYEIPMVDMLSKRKPAKVAHARQVVSYLCKIITSKSSFQIGQALGRDHTTVLHGIAKIENAILTDKKLAKDIETIRGMIGA